MTAAFYDGDRVVEQPKDMALPDFLAYCQKQGYVPQRIVDIKAGKAKLQHDPEEIATYHSLTTEEVGQRATEYFAAKGEIARLEEELKSDIKALKAHVANAVKPLQDTMDSLEPAITTRKERRTVGASWERDVVAGIAIHVRHDTLDVLAIRPLEPDGRENQADLFDSANPSADKPTDDNGADDDLFGEDANGE